MIRSKLARFLSSQTTLALSALVFLVSFLLLPIKDYSSSHVGQWLYDKWRPGLVLTSPARLDRSVFEFVNGMFTFVKPDSWQVRIDEKRVYVRGMCRFNDPTFGWWAATTTDQEIRIESLDELPPGASTAEFRRAYVDYLASPHPFVSRFAKDLIDKGQAQIVETRWIGWLHNIVSLISLLIAIVSTPFAFAHDRRISRFRKGLCHKCRYDRDGLAADAPCPECGAAQLKPES